MLPVRDGARRKMWQVGSAVATRHSIFVTRRLVTASARCWTFHCVFSCFPPCASRWHLACPWSLCRRRDAQGCSRGAAQPEVIVGLLVFILFGLVVGFLARALMPGRQSMGLIMTSALGMVGSLLGGFLGSLVSPGDVTRVPSAGLIGSLIGALLVLALVSAGTRRRSLL